MWLYRVLPSKGYSVMQIFLLLLSVLLSTLNKKRLKPLLRWSETLLGAEGGTRTPMPVKAQRPERCVSTNFTTSARLSIMDEHYITVSLAACQVFFSTIVLQSESFVAEHPHAARSATKLLDGLSTIT